MPVLNINQSNLGSVLFGQPTTEAVDYFTNVKNQIFQKASVFQADFIETGKQMFESVYSARALELTKAAINKAGSLFAPNLIKRLTTLEELQTAKPIMQRYIMLTQGIVYLKHLVADGSIKAKTYGDGIQLYESVR